MDRKATVVRTLPCARCGAILELREKADAPMRTKADVENVLRESGWRETRKGWVCPLHKKRS